MDHSEPKETGAQAIFFFYFEELSEENLTSTKVINTTVPSRELDTDYQRNLQSIGIYCKV